MTLQSVSWGGNPDPTENLIASPRSSQQAAAGSLATRCAGCGIDVSIRHGVTTTSGGVARAVTYADTDIVVWDCPDCAFANADVLTEA